MFENKNNIIILGKAFSAVFDNEENNENQGTEGDDSGIGKTTDVTPSPKDDGKESQSTFTQEQVNSMLASQKRTLQKQLNEQVTKLENISRTASLTKEEKEALASQVSSMKQVLETEKQKAAREKAEQKSQYEMQIKDLSLQKDKYKSLFENQSIKRSISDAASAHKAIQNSQVLAILEPHTSLVEETNDDGVGLGVFKPVVKFADKDKEGKPVTLRFTPEEAVKRMTELAEFSNLFESTNKGGIGKTRIEGNTGPVTLQSAAKSDNWAQDRKQLGLK